MSLKLAGKTALVTGASKGIGAAIAKDLAAAGAAVAVNYSSSLEGAEKVVNQIIADGGRAIAIQGSVNSYDDVQRIINETKNAFGSIDILVNNAGVYNFLSAADFDEEEYNRQFSVNVLGPFLTIKEALPHFPEHGGSIINISSVVSDGPLANSSIYAATKGALDTITKALAVELGPKNIRVNSVAPGPVETEGFETTGIKGSDTEQFMINSTPLGRLGQPDDIARAVTFLASDESAWITGQKVNASGGLR